MNITAKMGLPFSLPLLDQIVLDSCKIMGIWRSHAGIHKDPQAGIEAADHGLEEDFFLLPGIVRPPAPRGLGRGQLEE